MTIQNWRNIGRLDLDGLDHPLVVLHGPNRTGKSGLVLALRYCLFDHDHDSGHSQIRDAIPWHSRKTPEVTVEFETAGNRYRLMKRFSKRADGDAVLERQADGGNWITVERGKEAGREARRILGGEKSNEGLNELLWLTQGEIRLPVSSKLNAPLKKRLEEVLGSLLTSHDFDFCQRLEKACQTYFTGKMAEKKGSPVVALTEQHAVCEQKLLELRRKAADSEALVRDYESMQQEIEEERALVGKSRSEVDELKQDAQATRVRRQEYEKARLQLATAEKQQHEARARLEDYRERKQEWSNLDRETIGTEHAVTLAGEDEKRAAEELQLQRQSLSDIRGEIEQAERRRGELDDLRQLVEIDREAASAVEALKRFDEIDAAIQTSREELSHVEAPTAAELKGARADRREAQKLAAILEASALRLEVESQAGARFEISIDGEMPQAISGADEPRHWQLRQRAELAIDGFGRLRVARGQNDLSLDETHHQLEQLNRQYRDFLAVYGLTPEADDALEQLAERQTRRDRLQAELRSETEKLQQIAPAGREPLAMAVTRCEQRRRAILERRPELCDWTPDRAAVDEQSQEHDRQAAALRARQRDIDALMTTKQTEKERADTKLQNLRIQLAERKAARSTTLELLKRLGDELTLTAACEAADKDVCDAETRVTAAKLTADEQNVEERLEEAETALERRRGRLSDLEKRAETLRGQLLDREGLHDELTAAEAQLTEIARELGAKRTDADAHRLLHQTFEACRSAQVQQTTGLIGTQVMDWAHRLGLEDYHEIAFSGNGYLPDGLMRPDAEQTVSLDEESFGTLEQLALLVRLALGRLVTRGERHLTILDDPLTHADSRKHRRMLEILDEVSQPQAAGNGSVAAFPLQTLILTCHPERFDHLRSAKQINLADLIARE